MNKLYEPDLINVGCGISKQSLFYFGHIEYSPGSTAGYENSLGAGWESGSCRAGKKATCGATLRPKRLHISSTS
jgi:hypothetical protein